MVAMIGVIGPGELVRPRFGGGRWVGVRIRGRRCGGVFRIIGGGGGGGGKLQSRRRLLGIVRTKCRNISSKEQIRALGPMRRRWQCVSVSLQGQSLSEASVGFVNVRQRGVVRGGMVCVVRARPPATATTPVVVAAPLVVAAQAPAPGCTTLDSLGTSVSSPPPSPLGWELLVVWQRGVAVGRTAVPPPVSVVVLVLVARGAVVVSVGRVLLLLGLAAAAVGGVTGGSCRSSTPPRSLAQTLQQLLMSKGVHDYQPALVSSTEVVSRGSMGRWGGRMDLKIESR